MALTSAQRMAALDELQKTRSQAANVYEQYVGSGGTVNLLAQQALQKKMGQSPFVEESARLREQQQLTPTTYAKELREGRFAGDPTLAAAAAAQREAGIQRRLGTIQGYQQEREGSVKDIAGAITAGYQAQTDKARANLDRIDQEFSQQLSMAQFAAQEEERQRQAKALTWINAGNKTVGVDSNGNVVRTIAHAVSSPQPKPTQPAFNQKQIADAYKIMNDPMLDASLLAQYGGNRKLLQQAIESGDVRGDNTLSFSEALQAIDRLREQGLNQSQAAELFATTWLNQGFNYWDQIQNEAISGQDGFTRMMDAITKHQNQKR